MNGWEGWNDNPGDGSIKWIADLTIHDLVCGPGTLENYVELTYADINICLQYKNIYTYPNVTQARRYTRTRIISQRGLSSRKNLLAQALTRSWGDGGRAVGVLGGVKMPRP